MKISQNKVVAGRIVNMMCGLVAIADGLVRIFSIGFLCTDFQLSFATRVAMKKLETKKSQD